jgi:hypothetical protein
VKEEIKIETPKRKKTIKEKARLWKVLKNL